MAVIDLEQERGRKPVESYRSVAVIGGGGQTGSLFVSTLEPITRVYDVRRGGIAEAIAKLPELVILATPNPTREPLSDIAEHALHAKKTSTLVLPQNGVDAAVTAQEVLNGFPFNLVRASLLTTVSRTPQGQIDFNPDNKRIALALVAGTPDSLQMTAATFGAAGFDVEVLADARSMEYEKLFLNLLGSTSTITGLTPYETFNDEELFAMELQASKDRKAIMRAAGINFAIKWTRSSRYLANLPKFTERIPSVREKVADMIAGQRNNQPSAAARQIENGARIVEATHYYHEALVHLGRTVGLESPVDEAILAILKGNERKIFSLASLSKAERRALLLEAYGLRTKEVFIKAASVLGVEYKGLVVDLLFRMNTESLTVSGKENLEPAAESLRSGKSVLIAPNHRSHADHTTVMTALREQLPADVRRTPVYIVAGMKFDEEEFSNRFKDAYPHPVVFTLTRGDSAERWRAQIVNSKASHRIDDLLREPCIFVVYLEGGRSKIVEDGKVQLQRGSIGSSLWLRDARFGLVVPTVITGTEKMMAPGQQRPSRAALTIEFCPGIPASEFRNKRNGNGVISASEYDAFLTDKVLREIAARLPEDQRGVYR